MNPHQKPRPLFFTPRSPWGRLPLKRAHQSHMHASEGELPEEDKDGVIQGKIESTGGTHGKPETKFDLGINLNPHGHETANYQDPFWEQRVKDKAKKELAALAETKKQHAAQRAQPAQQPRKPSRWKFKSIPASEQKLPGAY